MYKYIYTALFLVFSFAVYILFLPSENIIKITHQPEANTVTQPNVIKDLAIDYEQKLDALEFHPIANTTLLSTDLIQIAASNDLFSEFHQAKLDINEFKRPFFNIIKQGRSKKQESKILNRLKEALPEIFNVTTTQIACSTTQCLIITQSDDHSYYSNDFCTILSTIIFDCSGALGVQFGQEGFAWINSFGILQNNAVMDTLTYSVNDFYRLPNQLTVNLAQQSLDSFQLTNRREGKQNPAPNKNLNRSRYLDILSNWTPQITAVNCELGLCFINIEKYYVYDGAHSQHDAFNKLNRLNPNHCVPKNGLGLTLVNTDFSKLTSINNNPEFYYLDEVIVCSVIGTKEQLIDIANTNKASKPPFNLFNSSAKLDSEKFEFLQQLNNIRMIQEQSDLRFDGTPRYKQENPIITAYKFDKNLEFNQNQKSLNRLVQSNFSNEYLDLMNNGYSKENTQTIGAALSQNITFNHQSTSNLCDNKKCLLQFNKFNDSADDLCTNIDKESYRCEHLEFKDLNFVLVNFPKTHTQLSKVSQLDQQELIEQGLIQTMITDYINTKISNTLVSKKYPLSISDIQCFEQQCNVSIINGAFVKNRNNEFQTKIKFDLSEQCKLPPIEPATTGSIATHWTCSL